MSFFKDGKDYDQKVKRIGNNKGKNHWLYGKKHSEETKAKLSAVNLGKTLSDEHRAKIRAGKLGDTHSEETKAKMSASSINRHGIKCHTPDGIFDSLKLAAKHYGKTEQCISYRVLGKNGKKGDKWSDWYVVK